MRIVAVPHFYLPIRHAGSEVMLHELLVALKDDGHEITVLTVESPVEGGYYEYEDVSVYDCHPRRMVQKLRELNPDVVIAQHHAATKALHVQSLRAKTVLMVHSDPRHVAQQIKAGADLTVFNTRWLAERHASISGPSIVVHPPVWPYQHQSPRGDCVTLVNLSRDKGVNTFYELAQRMPQHKFLGVTGGYGDQLRMELSNVELVPTTDDMAADVWSRTKVLLVPSVHESYGMVAVEALASGIPVIATPTEGLCESLSYAGTFVGLQDRQGWFDALTELLEDENAYFTASQQSLWRSAELDPTEELAAFCRKVGEL